MAARTGNGKAEEPVKTRGITPSADRIPLVEVVFCSPVEVTGSPVLLRRLVDDVPLENGDLPPFSFDPELRVVICGRDMYPAEMIQRMRRKH